MIGFNQLRVPLLVWFLIPTFLIVGLGAWFLSKTSTTPSKEGEVLPAAVSNPVEGTQDFEIVGRNHIPGGTFGSGYNSNPPSSGPHWASPAKNGFYDSALPDEQLIHNLEHGHVWIAYKPDVGEEIKNELKKIAEDEDWKVVVASRDKNETKIACVAWGRVLKMDEPDFDKIRDFIKTYRNRGPEKTPE